jgi:hypothetical protein
MSVDIAFLWWDVVLTGLPVYVSQMVICALEAVFLVQKVLEAAVLTLKSLACVLKSIHLRDNIFLAE